MQNQFNILVIEDEPGISAFLKQGLEEEGYEVHCSAYGKEGLAFALNNTIDLILLDWMLPDLSGLEICAELRQRGVLIPIIFLTAKDTSADTVTALKAGANDYIKKPFDFDELLARIEVQMRDFQDTTDKLTLDNISLHRQSREVYLDQETIHLTQKEFDLLAYLMLHKNKVCDRKQILADVWDIHFDYDSSVLDVYMNAIRKKLNLNKDDKTLQTIRGIGFMAKES